MDSDSKYDSSVPLIANAIFEPNFRITALNISQRITCHVCKKPFSNIQQHLYNSQVCKEEYSIEQMDRLLKLADAKKKMRASMRQQDYCENHKEEISAKRAKTYIKNKSKKYETGIGLRQIEALHKEDIEKYKIATEWIKIMQADGCDRATMKLISNNLKVDWKYDGDIIPLRISIQELQEPSIIKFLKFLELTPPNADMMFSFSSNSKNEPCWTFPKQWDDCTNGKCGDVKCDSLIEMKKRFAQEIYFSWNHEETDRGMDQWLDPIDCRGCKYSFKNLTRHLSMPTTTCTKNYSESELKKLRDQPDNRSTLNETRNEAALKKSAVEKEQQLSVEDKMRREEIQKSYRPKIEVEVCVEIPKYLLPFKQSMEKLDNKLRKEPIKIKNFRKYYV